LSEFFSVGMMKKLYKFAIPKIFCIAKGSQIRICDKGPKTFFGPAKGILFYTLLMNPQFILRE